ncbi:MAG: ABC transporter permease [Marinilabiliales bacterium]|nr:ABC transporter permease [Marinilabiliales bacterium]
MQNPESSISFWFSMIPLTSPIVMVARIPFDVPAWEIALSMALMLVTIIRMRLDGSKDIPHRYSHVREESHPTRKYGSG